MTHLFYRLDEAARELDISETVLVRLSQTLRVPEAAYENTGYLSFKGDLNFSDHDISFFRQVKQRLLAGESLEDIKRRAQRPESIAAPPPVAIQSTEPLQAGPLQEVVHSAPEDVDNLADQNFERYKHQNRGGTLKVFKKMLDEVAKGPQKPLPQQPLSAKPLKPRADEARPEKRILPRIEPFTRPTAETAPEPVLETPPAVNQPLLNQPVAELDDFYPAAPEDETPRRYRDEDYAHHNPMPQLPKMPALPAIGSLFGGGKKAPKPSKPAKTQEFAPEDFDIPENYEDFEVEKPKKQGKPAYASQPEAPVFDYEPDTDFRSPWETLIRESAKDPRDLSIHLKTAAQVLREKALKQGKTPASGPYQHQEITFS